MSTSAESLKQLLALAAKATPGPWGNNCGDIGTLTDAGKGYPLDFYPDSKEVVTARECHCGATGRLQINGADLSYIAACSPDVIAELVTELLAARRQRKCGRCGNPCELWMCEPCNATAMQEALSDPTRYK